MVSRHRSETLTRIKLERQRPLRRAPACHLADQGRREVCYVRPAIRRARTAARPAGKARPDALQHIQKRHRHTLGALVVPGPVAAAQAEGEQQRVRRARSGDRCGRIPRRHLRRERDLGLRDRYRSGERESRPDMEHARQRKQDQALAERERRRGSERDANVQAAHRSGCGDRPPMPSSGGRQRHQIINPATRLSLTDQRCEAVRRASATPRRHGAGSAPAALRLGKFARRLGNGRRSSGRNALSSLVPALARAVENPASGG